MVTIAAARKNESRFDVTISPEYFSELSRVDKNRIHSDDEYAREFGRKYGLPIKKRIFHGMGTLAIGLTRLLEREQQSPEAVTEVNVSFISPVELEDKIRYKFNIENDRRKISAINQNEKQVVNASITLGERLPSFLNPFSLVHYWYFLNDSMLPNSIGRFPTYRASVVERTTIPIFNFEPYVGEDIGLGMMALEEMPAISGVLGERFPGRNTLWGSHSGRYFSVARMEERRDVFVDLYVKERPIIDKNKKFVKVVLGSKVYTNPLSPTSLKFLGEEVVFVPNPYFE